MSAARRHAEVISISEQRAARERAAAEGVARPRCRAETSDGRRCRNYAVDQGHCRIHAPRPAPEDVEAIPSDVDDDVAEARRRAAQEAERRGWQPPVDAVAALRDAAGSSWPDHLQQVAAFLRRRLTGDYTIDEFGFDEDLTNQVLMPLIRPLHRYWWRVASHGAEHLPTTGGGLVVANHAGTLPADALITRLDILEQTGRNARELAADLVMRTPFVGPFARKTGATLASGTDADRLLARGELVAVWPEGFKGVGKPWRDRYKLQRFGRGGFVATALRAQVPILPTAIVGSEEIYPLLYDLRLLARMLGLPYFPIVPQMFALPVLGPFALLPLPSKWVIEYGEPIDTSAYGPEAADDPMAVFELTDHVRNTIQQMLHRNLMGRRSVFL
ncbi:lysophospholipid acyltransferase family protein [Egicoccus sp. AB-alg2]|uniref:lysophospholipid acyltransferase family protein n=1 Tax=Egicoccus sp. AB-alg2 TaxID=3242693 RepID=UPI00359D3EF5